MGLILEQDSMTTIDERLTRDLVLPGPGDTPRTLYFSEHRLKQNRTCIPKARETAIQPYEGGNLQNYPPPFLENCPMLFSCLLSMHSGLFCVAFISHQTTGACLGISCGRKNAPTSLPPPLLPRSTICISLTPR